MSDPFFLPAKNKSNNKNDNTLKRKRFSREEDEDDVADRQPLNIMDYSSDSSSDDGGADEEDFGETVSSKRIRLANQIIEKATDETRDEYDTEDPNSIAGIIRSKIRRTTRPDTIQRLFADKLIGKDIKISKTIKGPRLSPTAVILTPDDTTAYASSKDASIIKLDIETSKKIYLRGQSKNKQKQSGKGHIGQVLSLAVSSDGNMLASGGHDRLVRLWDTRSNTLIHSFKGHKDIITGLCFKWGGTSLYSASKDRSVKLWDIETKGYIETLYGHTEEINSLHVGSWKDDKILTSGSDCTVRLWKIAEETHLIYRGNFNEHSVDCVTMINEYAFCSGAQDGTVALWHMGKKKPVYQIRNALGDGIWISSLASCRGGNMVACGGKGGIRMFGIFKKDGGNKMEQVGEVKTEGFVNAIAVAGSGKFVVAGIGQEPRLGRWERVSSERNRIAIIDLPITSN